MSENQTKMLKLMSK